MSCGFGLEGMTDLFVDMRQQVGYCVASFEAFTLTVSVGNQTRVLLESDYRAINS